MTEYSRAVAGALSEDYLRSGRAVLAILNDLYDEKRLPRKPGDREVEALKNLRAHWQHMDELNAYMDKNGMTNPGHDRFVELWFGMHGLRPLVANLLDRLRA